MGLLEFFKSFLRRTVTVKFIEAEYTYDGKPHAAQYRTTGLPSGFSIIIKDVPTIQNVGEERAAVAQESCVILNKSNRDVTKRFSLQIVPAKIVVKPKLVTITAGSSHKVWDGSALTCTTYTTEGLACDQTIAVSTTGRLTHVGSAVNEIEIDWDASTAHPNNYSLRLIPGTLHIDPAELIVQIEETEVYYNGQPQLPSLTIPEGARIWFSRATEHIDAGAYDVAFIASMPNHSNCNGLARLLIKPASLTLHSESASKTYDGKPLISPGVSISGLIPGEFLQVEAVGSITEVGEVQNEIQIDWGASSAKQQNYVVSLAPGVLSIRQARLTIGNCKTVCTYDGQPHGFTIEIPEGASVIFSDPSSYTAVGTYTTNYIASQPGYESAEGEAELTIAEYSEPIVIGVKSAEFVYDGLEHHAEINLPVLPDGYSIADAQSTATVKDVAQGAVIATCDFLKIENCEGEDVTGRLNIVYNDGLIRTIPRELTVFTFDAKRPYNGSELKAPGKLLGLCAGETATLSVTGKQLDVGKSTNTYELTFDGTALEKNYVIKECLGSLTVLPAEKVSLPHPQKAKTPITSTTQPHENNANTDANVRDADLAIPQARWIAPEIIYRKPVRESGPHGAKRAFRPRPVEKRSNLEDAGYGHSFKPFDLADPCFKNVELRDHLLELENKSRGVIDELLEDNPEAPLCECFDALDDDLGKLIDAFRRIFAAYRSDMRYATVWIDKHWRNAFLLSIAIMTRNCFDGDSLWIPLFKLAGIQKSDIQTKAKQMFIAYTYQRRLLICERNETHTYIADTAILHGGLSRSSWKDLWVNSLIPLSKRHKLSQSSTGEQVFSYIINNPSYGPCRKTTKKLLETIPTASLSRLLSSAWSMANQLSEAESYDDVRFLPSYGLPKVALLALEDALDASNTYTQAPKAKVLTGSPMDLRLNIAEGCVQLCWEKETTSHNMAGTRIDIIVNEEPVKTLSFLPTVGGYAIKEGSISLTPHDSYTVERRIMRSKNRRNDDSEWQEIASLRQHFANSKPGCFEFIRDSHGTYRIRSQGKRITKTHRIAYLVGSGRRVEGRHGMRLINSMHGLGKWSDMSIFEFEVKPGSAGIIFDETADSFIAGWNEDYSVKINKKHAIGTANGLDLFGHALGTGETDVALPEININTMGSEAAQDVEVRFIRDDKQGKLNATWNIDENANTAVLHLSFPTSEEGRGIAGRCIIEARQKSTTDILLRYSFAIVPIQGFRLEDYKISPTTQELIGIYQFEATEPIALAYSDGAEIEQLETGSQSNIEAPLQQEAVSVRMTDGRKKTIEAHLFLAGIEIHLPAMLQNRAETTSYIGLPSARTLPFSAGIIQIDVKGNRSERRVALKLGRRTLSEKELGKPGNVAVNIFDDESLFNPVSKHPYQKMPLTVMVSFGYRYVRGVYERAEASYDILACGKGLEFLGCRMLIVNGERKLRLLGAPNRQTPSCRLMVTFLNRRGLSIGSAIIKPGEAYIDLPPDVEDIFNRNQPIVARFEMISRFGNKADHSRQVEIALQRGRN